MHPDKGIDLAIQAARRAGKRLVIAAKMREQAEHAYFHDVIEPLLGEDVTYIGEADVTAKIALLRGADALVNPIRWPEPFGLVMIEALACGTPVIATPNGAAPEIVTPGVNGWLATSVDDLAAAINRVGEIDRRQCRRDATNRFSLQAMAAEHENLYHRILTGQHSPRPSGGHPGALKGDQTPAP
jgi:glycosyltransferase involved in cell wall biosynthesis